MKLKFNHFSIVLNRTASLSSTSAEKWTLTAM